MKLTTSALKQIIKEELQIILNELTDKDVEELEQGRAAEQAAEGSGTVQEAEGDGWPKKVKKGRFTNWCKRNGFEDGASISCAKEAMASKSASVRGMATFYMNTVKPKGKDAGDI